MYEAARLIVTSLVLPPGGPIVAAVFGALVLRPWPRLGRAGVLVGAMALWLSALPIVANALVTALGGARPLDMVAAGKADAIVILGGGVRSGAVEFGGDTLGRLTLERVRYGAFLARRTGLPVLVTGGAPEEGIRAEADLMREALQGEFGVTVRWADDRARNTRENAERAARLLLVENKRRVVVVMHGFDVKRARAQFTAAGLDVIPAPTQVPLWEGPELADFLPNAAALVTTHYAVYELLALGRDWLLASPVVSPKVFGRGN